MKLSIGTARDNILAVTDAFTKDWEANPSTGVRALLGHWMVDAFRHIRALIALCEEQDLSMVADAHNRQLFEILLQVRHFLSYDENQRERIAQKISAMGCIDFLEKLEPLKDHPIVMPGYLEAERQLKEYDPDIVEEIREDRAKRIWYWFGKSFSSLAEAVSGTGQDLKTVYQLRSAEMHGSWALTFGVANPEPGSLDLRGYPNRAVMYEWAADLVDESVRLYVSIWNAIAQVVKAPAVSIE